MKASFQTLLFEIHASFDFGERGISVRIVHRRNHAADVAPRDCRIVDDLFEDEIPFRNFFPKGFDAQFELRMRRGFLLPLLYFTPDDVPHDLRSWSFSLLEALEKNSNSSEETFMMNLFRFFDLIFMTGPIQLTY